MRSRLFVFTVLMGALATAAFGMTPDTQFMNQNGQMVPGIRCGTVDIGPPDLARAPFDLDAWIKEHGSLADKVEVTIPIAFHVLWFVKWDQVIGTVTDQQITDQVAVLNAAYAGTGISFTHLSTDRTENKKWATMRPGGRAEQECKAALAVDPAHTLNVYTTYPSGGLLGWSYFPWSFEETHYMHGSVIHFGTLPGGYADPYNEGDTATHEIGHYVGLYHPFQGGCTEPNDYCDDTPQEASPAFGCPHGRDSCPDDPGLDPIYNFMDYTDDYCMDHFTPDQIARMDWALTTYKPLLLGGKVMEPQVASADYHNGIKGVFPNPFNPKTQVSFFLSEDLPVEVAVYDLAGRKVQTLVSRTLNRGEHNVEFDGKGLPSAVYFLVMQAGEQRFTEKLVLLK